MGSKQRGQPSAGAEKTRSTPANVPVVMQMEALECGAASLCMILAYHKKWVPLEQLRTRTGVSRDGISARAIYDTALTYGLEPHVYRYDARDIRSIPTPSILHWDFNHFVVFCGVRRGRAVLNDPARGRVSVPLQEFARSFTGVVLTFAPGELFEPGGAPVSIWSFAAKRLEGTLGAFLLVIALNLMLAAVGMVKPLFSKVFLDTILPNTNPEWSLPFLLLMGGVLVFGLVVSYLQSAYLLRIRGKFALVSNCEFMWHILRLPMSFFSQRYAGDLETRQKSNESITQTLLGELAPQFINLLMVVLYLVIMLQYSVALTVVGLASIGINTLVLQLVMKKLINVSRIQMREAGKSASSTVSGIEMIETIKASGAEAGYFERWAGYQASEGYESNAAARTVTILNAIAPFLTSLSNATVLLLGSYLIIQGSFTPGMLLAFQGLLSEFLAPAMGLSQTSSSIQRMRASMERVEDVMQYPTDVEYDDAPSEARAQPAQKLSGEIELRDVTFGYNKNQPPLISDLNLQIRPGDKIAFVGGSGCGKSTLTKLISGLYQPWAGSVRFDGKPIGEIDRMVFTGSLAVVDQDIVLFEDTISNNIRMWDTTIENFEMILAARDAQVHDEIMLREGYQTKLLEGGKNFSGGQRQRIEIARVLAQDPSIIILDEATSALDSKTEYEVINAIKDRGITCIIVAHRLSTIRDCDEIIVLDQGRVAQRGTHETLMAQEGLYQTLITTE